ncbi:MAG: hypothetical protein ACXVE9_17910, partial [Solirubrobacteraceae bacterium]
MQATTTHLTRRFFRHYAEMVVAMFLGMFALSKPAEWLFSALGTSTSSQHPAMMLLSMGLTMTVPMVAWMRYRGHAWRPTNEMAASMLIPTLVAMALVVTGVMNGGPVMVVEHVAMLAGMLIAMLLRRDEYAGAAHAHGAAREAIAAYVLAGRFGLHNTRRHRRWRSL